MVSTSLGQSGGGWRMNYCLPWPSSLSSSDEGIHWGGHEEEEGGGEPLEGMAGTLRRLAVGDVSADSCDPPPAVLHQLGVAIGKLRRLRYLHLYLFGDGRSYRQVGRGLAASEVRCPELFHLRLSGERSNFDMMAYEPALIVPSVRDFQVAAHFDEGQALVSVVGPPFPRPGPQLVVFRPT
jgi:hypothetical protein